MISKTNAIETIHRINIIVDNPPGQNEPAFYTAIPTITMTREQQEDPEWKTFVEEWDKNYPAAMEAAIARDRWFAGGFWYQLFHSFPG